MLKVDTSKYNFPVDRVVSYLQSEGWQLAHENDGWYVLEGYETIDGDPFRISLPKNIIEWDTRLYVYVAVDIVSTLTDRSHEEIMNELANTAGV